MAKLQEYISVTCLVSSRELSWVKIYNVDQRYEANRIDGERAAIVLFSMCDSVLNNYAKGYSL